MLILLIGPKGSGKSHIGRTLDAQLGVHFFHVEPLWMSYYEECRANGTEPNILEGIAKVHPRISACLRAHDHVCVETTGASPEILNDLLDIESPRNTLIAQILAPLELCLNRIATRDQTNQIPMDIDSVRRVYSLSLAAEVQPQIVIENVSLSDMELVKIFKNVIPLAISKSQHG